MNDQELSCGHPIQAASEMLPDFIGDTPATQKIGTVYCRWCNDVARAEARVKELEEALSDLLDEQNGPPLIRNERAWQAAFEFAKRAKHRGWPSYWGFDARACERAAQRLQRNRVYREQWALLVLELSACWADNRAGGAFRGWVEEKG